jgi:hypothetical protein
MPTEYALAALSRPRISQLLQQLARQENLAEQNSGPNGDKRLRREAERSAENTRRSLVQEADAALLYHYLKTTAIADADAFRAAWQTTAKKVDVWE